MWDSSGSLFALGLRLTNLASTGAPLSGANNAYVTNVLLSLGIGLEYRDGAEIEQVGGSGATCLYYKAPDTLKRGTISDMQVCLPDPNILQFAIGGEVITGAGAAEVQTVTITGTPTGGDFTLTNDGQTTADIAFDAAASAVQSALEALSNLAPGDVTVSGAAGGPYTVTFTVTQGNVPQLTADGSGLTGGVDPDVTVATTTSGNDVTTVGYRAPEVGIDAKPNGVSIEFWTRAVEDGAIADTLPYIHFVIPRAYLKPSGEWVANGENPLLPGFEGWSNQNRNWGTGPAGDWPYPSDRVWQFARVDTIPDLTPGFLTVP